MANITTPITAPGSITAPTTVGITLPTIESDRWFDGLPISTVTWDETFHAVFMFNGYDEVRHIVNGEVVTTGILPPRPDQDMTATPSGTRATAILDLQTVPSTDYTIADQDQIVLGPESSGSGLITFVDTLSAIFVSHEVLIGGSNGTALDNLIELVSQTAGGEGVNYNTAFSYGDIWTANMTVSASDTSTPNDMTVTFQAIDYGTGGNGLFAWFQSGGWQGGTGTPTFGSQGNTQGSVGNFENGANGSGTAPDAGSYEYAYRYYRKADGAYSDISDRATADQGTPQNIDLALMIASGDPDVDHTEWLRTKASGETLIPGYRFQDTGGTDEEDTDDLVDSDLEELGGASYDFSIYRNYASGMIPRFRYGTAWKGRLWGGGAVLSAKKFYATISFTKGSTSFTYSTGVADSGQVGRTISVGGGNFDGQSYIIVEVDEAAGTGRMNRTWPHTTGGYACDVIDLRNPFALYYSEPLLPNNFPPANEITGIQGGDSYGITGIIATTDRLVVFTRTSMWVVTGSGLSSFNVSKISDSIGCASGHALVSAEGTLIWLGMDGVYAWRGGTPNKLSSPSTIGDRARGIDATMARVNWESIIWSHGRYDPILRTVEIYVPLDSDTIPKHSLVVDLDSQGVWSVDRVPGFTSSSQILNKVGRQISVAGDEHGNLFQMDVSVTDTTTEYHPAFAADQGSAAIPTKGHTTGDFSTTDGHTVFRAQKRGILHKMSLKAICAGDVAYGFDPVQTPTAGTVNSATVSGAPFTASALLGASCLIVRAAGTIETAKIISNTTTVVVFTDDLASAVTTSDQIVLGGFVMDIETGRADMGLTRQRKILAHVIVNHSPAGQTFTGFTWAMGSSGQGDI